MLIRILLAEDDVETAEFICVGLSALGQQIVRAAAGEVALSLAITEQFNAIVLDRMLPGLDGLSVLGRCASWPATWLSIPRPNSSKKIA